METTVSIPYHKTNLWNFSQKVAAFSRICWKSEAVMSTRKEYPTTKIHNLRNVAVSNDFPIQRFI